LSFLVSGLPASGGTKLRKHPREIGFAFHGVNNRLRRREKRFLSAESGFTFYHFHPESGENKNYPVDPAESPPSVWRVNPV